MYSIYAEIRLDAFDLMYKHQRPALVEAEDIGTWYDVLRLSSVICVVTNAALVVFTMNNLDNYTIGGKIWIFIGFQVIFTPIHSLSLLICFSTLCCFGFSGRCSAFSLSSPS